MSFELIEATRFDGAPQTIATSLGSRWFPISLDLVFSNLKLAIAQLTQNAQQVPLFVNREAECLCSTGNIF